MLIIFVLNHNKQFIKTEGLYVQRSTRTITNCSAKFFDNLATLVHLSSRQTIYTVYYTVYNIQYIIYRLYIICTVHNMYIIYST